jgi:predicted SnoaL-like aldol condensation-catalyzing enzyme
MIENPYDPRKRKLSKREAIVMDFMENCLHGDDITLIDKYMAADYIQHTAGIGQGREGLKRYYTKVASKRPGRKEWRPIHLFECGNFVILHKLLPSTSIVDILRFNESDQMAEHWDVVMRHPEPGYDPMRLSEENLGRFESLFAL